LLVNALPEFARGQWPEPLTADSYSDMESWVELVLRKIKRSIEEQAEGAGQS